LKPVGWVGGCGFVFLRLSVVWFRDGFARFLLFELLFGFGGDLAVFITTCYRMWVILRFLLTESGYFVIICSSREMVVLSSASVLRP
jgi:hypothetical protein